LRSFLAITAATLLVLTACGLVVAQTSGSVTAPSRPNSTMPNKIVSTAVSHDHKPMASAPAVSESSDEAAPSAPASATPTAVTATPHWHPKSTWRRHAETGVLRSSTAHTDHAVSVVSVAPAPAPAPATTEAPAKAVSSPASAASSSRTDRVAMFNQQDKAPGRPEKDNPNLVKTTLSMTVKLIAVLVLAYFSIMALKALSSGKASSPRIRSDMKVVDTVKLSPANTLHLIDIKGKTILVGCSAGQVNLLQEFETAEGEETRPGSDGRFAEYLARYSGKSTQNGPVSRIAGLLRDCAEHLKSSNYCAAKTMAQTGGDLGEA
jgi:flagellar biogenesis protein FliO